jgi:hypothetical protein
VEVRAAELVPFGDDDEAVGAVQRIVAALAQGEAGLVAIELRGGGPGCRVVGAHARAAREQQVHQRQARRLADVVGVGLEGEAPQRERASAQVRAEMRHDLVAEHALLPLVHRFHAAHDGGVVAHLARRVDQRLDVLREAGAAVAGAGVDEVVADPRIGADAAAHRLDVGAEPFGQVGEFVHEADPGRQHHVGRVLGEFRRAHVHVDDLVMIAVERRIQRIEQAGAVGACGADDDAVGFHEVVDRRTFLQELGVRDHVEVDRDAARGERLGHRRADPVSRADRHRRLVDDHRADFMWVPMVRATVSTC